MAINALVLNGQRRDDGFMRLMHETVCDMLSLEGCTFEPVILREKKIARCIGCFGCWTETPGICVIDDFGRELAEKVARCNLLVYLTPVTFGGYSSELKKAVDRFSCPMLLPFFTKIDGEVHHRARYRPLPRLMGIGVLPDQDEECERMFTKLVERNSINLHSPSSQSAVYYSSQPPEQIREGLRALLKGVKE